MRRFVAYGMGSFVCRYRLPDYHPIAAAVDGAP